jgi:hypothetical protein
MENFVWSLYSEDKLKEFIQAPHANRRVKKKN